VKQLQEKVKELENHQNKRIKDDSVILIKISDQHRYYSKEELPMVEARVIEKEILIEIHCEKQKDIVVRLMALLQNLHLSLASSSVLPFGTSTLKVTIIAQVIIFKQYFIHCFLLIIFLITDVIYIFFIYNIN
jgi:hypothetical protein